MMHAVAIDPYVKKKSTPGRLLLYVLMLSGGMLHGAARANGGVTFERLLREMADLESLAEYPGPPYLSGRFSSYARHSPADSVPVRFTNYDHGNYLDSLPEGMLMMDAVGPGVITHIWSAQSNGSLIFYFDGRAAPSWTIEMSALLTGTASIKSPFSCITARGENCYFPIPYRKHCKVVYAGASPDIYYHIDYRTYPQGTLLPTFDTGMISANASLIDSIGSILADTVSRTQGTPETGAVFTGKVAAQRTVTASTLDGPGAIVEMDVASDNGFQPVFLRKCLLEITFDGAVYPQVRVPLGDFFCAVPYQKTYRTLPLRIDADRTMISRWCMPYRTGAVIRLVNHSDLTAVVRIHVFSRPYTFTDNTMHFYARWRQDPAVVTSKNLYSIFYMADPPRDHPMLHITGKGVHVGTLLQIWNRENAWWGEGDDKIRIDDLPAPGIMGTGTEDYFGYAWAATTPFSHAFHAQPFADGRAGFVANLRFHISDPQPFTASYDFDIEIQTANRSTEIDFGRAVFFYAEGTAATDHDTLTEDDLFIRENKLAGCPPRIAHTPSYEPMLRYDIRRGIVVTAPSLSPPTEVGVRIFRSDGRLVSGRRDGGSFSIRTTALSPGVYIADAEAGGLRRRLRFVIDR
ncbi:MAG: DUF2961 domain-containing protein [Chitinispirillaceae bacterium]|nr:DUF2961 domain-containing protein [Chitinispirillaceae bacterium]